MVCPDIDVTIELPADIQVTIEKQADINVEIENQADINVTIETAPDINITIEKPNIIVELLKSGVYYFTSLFDTPNQIEAGKILRGNEAGDALEFVDLPVPDYPVTSVNNKIGDVELTTGDIPEDIDKNYVTDEELGVLQNTSGTNTGNQVGDGVTITGAGTAEDPFVANIGSSTIERSFQINYPIAGSVTLFRVPVGVTITRIDAVQVGGTNVIGMITECDANGINPVKCNSSDITVLATNTSSITFSNPNIDSGDYIGWTTTSVSGVPTVLIITIQYEVT